MAARLGQRLDLKAARLLAIVAGLATVSSCQGRPLRFDSGLRIHFDADRAPSGSDGIWQRRFDARGSAESDGSEEGRQQSQKARRGEEDESYPVGALGAGGKGEVSPPTQAIRRRYSEDRRGDCCDHGRRRVGCPVGSRPCGSRFGSQAATSAYGGRLGLGCSDGRGGDAPRVWVFEGCLARGQKSYLGTSDGPSRSHRGSNCHSRCSRQTA